MASRVVGYFQQLQYTADLDIEDIGNCAIRATSSLNLTDYYLVIKTVLGTTYVFQAGPYIVDQNKPSDLCIVSYTNFPYTEYKIEKVIDKFLNSQKAAIDQAVIISEDEALSACIDLAAYIKEIS